MKKLEPGSCLDLTCGGGEHTCDGRSCVRIQSFRREDLVAWFGDITEREKSEVQIVAECYTNTTVNIATVLGLFSRMCSLQSLETLESEHHLVIALSVESWPGALQITQKDIRGGKVGPCDPPCGEYNAGVAMDRRECEEISGVEDTDSGVDTRY